MALPNITSFNPTSGGHGQIITITGSNFTGTTQILFFGNTAPLFIEDSDTQLRVWVPDQPGVALDGPITVITDQSADSPTNFEGIYRDMGNMFSAPLEVIPTQSMGSMYSGTLEELITAYIGSVGHCFLDVAAPTESAGYVTQHLLDFPVPTENVGCTTTQFLDIGIPVESAGAVMFRRLRTAINYRLKATRLKQFQEVFTAGNVLVSVTSDYVLTHPPYSNASLLFFLKGKLLRQVTDYTVSGTTVTYLGGQALTAGDKLMAYYIYES